MPSKDCNIFTVPVLETCANLLFVTCVANRKKDSCILKVSRAGQIDISYTNIGGKATVGAEIILLVTFQWVETKIANDSLVGVCSLHSNIFA